ncbi:phosphatidate cytidylyltransferase [Desulfurobacterium atlanticum]|uniref:Phosphatidate cytidylyltransferase n=1 Tax=Desulfurobacterium atlanticum TaxID=240169 RepID=A0A238YBU9_9BACT|nr:phosphatidate cytidylyltransferase [Desulfurobacterium atlanticum]SNR68442.1 phosphatidate cytidylyltransferase [Desulfurobacterium atlanticum]
MKDRVIGAILVVAYALLLLKSQGLIYFILVLTLGLEIIGELLEITGLSEHRLIPYTVFSLSAVLFYNMHTKVFLIPMILLSLFFYFIVMEKKEPERFFPFSLFFIYVFIGIASITLFNKKLLLLLVSIVWAVDTLAYFTGMFFGKHKLAPSLSPKKTVEGAIGGSIGGTIVATFVAVKLNIVYPEIKTFIFIFFLTVVSQIGDLLESYIKRIFGVKDSGNIIPGHGGVFDRLDSSIAVAPFLLLLLPNSSLLF